MITKKLIFLKVLVSIIFLFSSCSTLSRIENAYENFSTMEEHFRKHGISMHEGSLPQFYHYGSQWVSRLKELIEEAEDYILFSLFLANLHDVTEEIWSLLIEKQQAGVEVYGIIDSSSNFQKIPGKPIYTPAALQILREHNIPVVEYNPFTVSKLFILPSLLYREHRKFWVFDGNTVATGGKNIYYTSIDHPPGIGDIDAMVETQSPGAAGEMAHSFIRTWNRYDPRLLHESDFPIPEAASSPADTSFWLVDSEPRGEKQVDAMLDGVFFSASEELWLIQGYAFSSKNLVYRVKEAVSRGVDVHIVFSDHQCNPSRRGAAYYSKLDYLNAGASVYLFSSPDESFLHCKIILADEDISVVGSINFNARSQHLSREIAFVFSDPLVNLQVRQFLDEILLNAHPVSIEDAQIHRTLNNRFHHMFMQLGG